MLQYARVLLRSASKSGDSTKEPAHRRNLPVPPPRVHLCTDVHVTLSEVNVSLGVQKIFPTVETSPVPTLFESSISSRPRSRSFRGTCQQVRGRGRVGPLNSGSVSFGREVDELGDEGAVQPNHWNRDRAQRPRPVTGHFFRNVNGRGRLAAIARSAFWATYTSQRYGPLLRVPLSTSRPKGGAAVLVQHRLRPRTQQRRPPELERSKYRLDCKGLAIS